MHVPPSRPRWCSLGFPYSASGPRWGLPRPNPLVCPPLVSSWLRPCGTTICVLHNHKTASNTDEKRLGYSFTSHFPLSMQRTSLIPTAVLYAAFKKAGKVLIKFDGGVNGQSRTSTPKKFEAVRRQNSLALGSNAN